MTCFLTDLFQSAHDLFRYSNYIQGGEHSADCDTPTQLCLLSPRKLSAKSWEGRFSRKNRILYMLLHGTLIPNFSTFLSIGVISERFLASLYDWVCLSFLNRLSVHPSVHFDVFHSICRLVGRLVSFIKVKTMKN